jgi:cation transport ATPase
MASVARLRVSGMVCGACTSAVQAALENIAGVSSGATQFLNLIFCQDLFPSSTFIARHHSSSSPC